MTLQPLAEAARAYAARKDSSNTRRAYAADQPLFERWCLRQGLDPLVPDPSIVGLFLAAAADGNGLPQVSVATLERRLAALTTRYRSDGTPLACGDRHITDDHGRHPPQPRPPRQKLPWQDRTVPWHLRVRCFRCGDCPGRIFAEPAAGLGSRKARRSERLAEAQTDIGMVLGGEPGARLSRRLAMPVSGDTVLRLISSTRHRLLASAARGRHR